MEQDERGDVVVVVVDGSPPPPAATATAITSTNANTNVNANTDANTDVVTVNATPPDSTIINTSTSIDIKADLSSSADTAVLAGAQNNIDQKKFMIVKQGRWKWQKKVSDDHSSNTDAKQEEQEEQQQQNSAASIKKIPYHTLYRYADSFDVMLIIIGTLCSMLVGVSQPLMSIVFGDLMQSLVSYPFSDSPTKDDDLRKSAAQGVIYLTIIGTSVLCAAYVMLSFWNWAGERQAKKLREEYLAAILRQDVGWFDKTATGDLTTRMIADVATIQDGISSKVALMLQGSTTFLSGFCIAFAKGPQLAGVLCCAFPLLGGASMLMAQTLKRRTGTGANFYADAGAIAQEVFSSIRTVTAFGGQKREIERYNRKLASAESEAIKSAMFTGASMGFVFMIIFCTYSLGFYYGGTLIGHGMTAGAVVNVFFAIIIGAFSLGQVGPNISAIGSAIGAGTKIFETIDRTSPIDASSDQGLKPARLEGVIEFHNVSFHYPQRPDVPVMKNFSLKILPGQTVALVGASGSGKSTIVKLIERFYDPVEGYITMDGHNLKDLNVKWLRQQIGLVGQEPVLFDKTVRENLHYGLRDSRAVMIKSKSVDNILELPSTAKEVEEAAILNNKVEECCKMANAWDFICALPKGVDTDVGEAGGMMSGGQKQRIAIARALMRDPSILLLDEATSALDTQSERVVQAALDKASKNRTSIVVAHRLSTIKNADLIVVMNEGSIIESGTHNELIELRNGAYKSLVDTQALKEMEDDFQKEEKPGGHVDSLGATDDFLLKSPEVSKAADVVPQFASLGRGATKAAATTASAIAVDEDVEMKDLKKKLQQKKEEEQKKKEIENAVKKRKMDWARLYGLGGNEILLYIVGVTCSAGAGLIFPIFSLVFSEIISVFGRSDENDRLNGVKFWAVMFVILSFAAFITNFGSISCFGIAGQKLTRRLREMTFAAILRQEIGFFDEDRHSTGALTSRLAEDANLVQGLVGSNMASIVQTISTMIAGLVIAFYHGPILTIIVLGVIPFIALAGAMQLRALTGFGSKSKEAYEEAAVVANEAIDQIRTVLTLTKEDAFLENYKNQLIVPFKIGVNGALMGAFGFAIAQGFIFLSYALAFYAGSQLVLVGKMDAPNVLIVMFAVIFTAISMGQASSFAPNVVQAKLATFSVFDLLDRKSAIDPTNQEGQILEKVEGHVDINKAHFKYPSRPDVPVLQGLDVSALPGKTVALVGPSGCGKSTVVALVERWYDAIEGSVMLDSRNVKELRVENLRSHLSLVGQEPVLFNLSIRENITYGAKNGVASQEEIEAAAIKANIHSFVITLPQGYNTIVGSKGGQLSGGQKQRIAIARALIRNPKVLLLDEATSALDSESEKIVQQALDAASKGRTTLVIAHRLSTIQTADKIIVVQRGNVVEQGSYSELVKSGGEFAQLVAAQSLGKN